MNKEMTASIGTSKWAWLLVSILLLSSFIGRTQTLKGTVGNAETGVPLRYATVSIIGKNQRVVTRRDGTFTLDISQVSFSDSITISYIGYQPAAYVLGDLDIATNQRFQLHPLVYTIEPVIVTAREWKTHAIGFTKPSSFRTGWGDFSSGRGRMRGVVIRDVDCSNPIKSFTFRIRNNEWDSVAFRLDLLPFKDGKPGNSLLPEHIIILTGEQNKWITVDLTQYHIIHCGDLLATLEWVDAWGRTGEYSNLLTLAMAKGTGTVFNKEAGEYEGKLEDGQPALAMYIEVFRY